MANSNAQATALHKQVSHSAKFGDEYESWIVLNPLHDRQHMEQG